VVDEMPGGCNIVEPLFGGSPGGKIDDPFELSKPGGAFTVGLLTAASPVAIISELPAGTSLAVMPGGNLLRMNDPLTVAVVSLTTLGLMIVDPVDSVNP
jgi:hypothetical protein